MLKCAGVKHAVLADLNSMPAYAVRLASFHTRELLRALPQTTACCEADIH